MRKIKSCCSDDAPAAHRLVEQFWKLGPAFTRWAESHMDQPGLTAQRVRLLVLLLKNGPMMMSHLRDGLGVTATNVTALVDALENDGMVTRRCDPSDRRAIRVEITEKAEAQLAANCEQFAERVATLFTGLSGDDQETLLRLLGKVKEALIERNILSDCE